MNGIMNILCVTYEDVGVNGRLVDRRSSGFHTHDQPRGYSKAGELLIEINTRQCNGLDLTHLVLLKGDSLMLSRGAGNGAESERVDKRKGKEGKGLRKKIRR